MKILITENQMRRVMFKFLNYLFEGIREVDSGEYPDSKIWKKDGEIILQLDEYEQLWVLRSIWNDIRDMFSINYPEINELIKEWGEENLELGEIILHPNKINPIVFNPD